MRDSADLELGRAHRAESIRIPADLTRLAAIRALVRSVADEADARSAGGARFKDERLLGAIEAARDGSAFDVVDSIRGAVDRFQAGMVPADDITLVVVGRQVRGRKA